MDEISEQYYFLRLYSIDMNTAREAIKVLRRYRKKDVQYALLRDITVTYARPFSTNKGDTIKKHKLKMKHVPKNMRELHNELLRVRMQQFAHTDLTYYNPKLARFSTKPKSPVVMAFKGYDYARLLRKLPDIEKLIKAVEYSIHKELREYERNF